MAHQLFCRYISLNIKCEKNFNCVLWIDADAVFLSSESLEHRFPNYCGKNAKNGKFDMIISKDQNGLNAGIILMKNTKWVKNPVKRNF